MVSMLANELLFEAIGGDWSYVMGGVRCCCLIGSAAKCQSKAGTVGNTPD